LDTKTTRFPSRVKAASPSVNASKTAAAVFASSFTRVESLGGSGATSGAEAAVRALDDQTVAGVRDEAQCHELAFFIDRDLDGASRAQLVQRPRVRVGAQVLHRGGVVHAGARKEAPDRVAALDALFTPVSDGVGVFLDRRQWQDPLDDAGRDRLEHRIRRRAEGRDGRKAHHCERRVLPGMDRRPQSAVGAECGWRLR